MQNNFQFSIINYKKIIHSQLSSEFYLNKYGINQ
jgi:hypothetical protein